MAKKRKRKTTRKAGRKSGNETIAKRLVFDRATWDAVELLARDRRKNVLSLIEEALADLLKKYGRSADLRETLELSLKHARKKKAVRKRRL